MKMCPFGGTEKNDASRRVYALALRLSQSTW